jgi:hypothetical protein
MRLLSIPSTLAGLRPFNLESEQDRLRDDLRAGGEIVLPGDCPRCGGVITRETCQVLRPGQPTVAMTIWRCHHHAHDGSPTCPPRVVESRPEREENIEHGQRTYTDMGSPESSSC